MSTILDHIPMGKANAVTRRELCSRLSLPDRTIRKLIEVERGKGAIIINDGDGEGYYQSEELEDMLAQYRTNNSRAKSILKQQKFLRRRIMEQIAARSGQVTIEEVDINECK